MPPSSRPSHPAAALSAVLLSTTALLHCSSAAPPPEGDEVDPAIASSEEALLTDPAGRASVRNFAFFAVSDLHFGHKETAPGTNASRPEASDECDEEDSTVDEEDDVALAKAGAAPESAIKRVNRALMGAMNTLVQKRSASAPSVRGVIATGDITDDARRWQWREYSDLYLNNPSFTLPMYETLGNHDYPSGAPTTFAELAALRVTSPTYVATQIAKRNNKTDHPGFVVQDENGSGSFAWKWNDILFVNLGVKASNRTESWLTHTAGSGEPAKWRHTNPFNSLDFLKRTLATYGRSTGPSAVGGIVLTFHYPIATGEKLITVAERTEVYNAIKGYPVKAIIHGHRHLSDLYGWCGIPVFEVDTPRSAAKSGSPGRGFSSFVAAQISGDSFQVRSVPFDMNGLVTDGSVGSACAAGSSNCVWSYNGRLSKTQVTQNCDVRVTTAAP